MPLVRVRHQVDVSDAVLEGLGPLLCETIAKHLNCGDEGGQLTSADVEVHFDAASPRDIAAFDLDIDVQAMHFSLRDRGNPKLDEPDFETRVRRIREDLEVAIPTGVTFGLFVKLNNAQWQSGEGAGQPLAGFQSGM